MSDSDTAGRRRDLQAGADLGPGPGPGPVAGGGGRTVDTVGAGANLRPDPRIGGQSEVGRREADQWEDRVWRTRSHSCCRLDSVSQQKWEYIKTILTLIKLTLGRCFASKDTFFLNLLLLESENFRREA